jgi:hypothetical protein
MMKLRAPNWPVTTFHWSLVMKPSLDALPGLPGRLVDQ